MEIDVKQEMEQTQVEIDKLQKGIQQLNLQEQQIQERRQNLLNQLVQRVGILNYLQSKNQHGEVGQVPMPGAIEPAIEPRSAMPSEAEGSEPSPVQEMPAG